MKPQLIQFTAHGPETLNHLIKKAAERGQTIKRGTDFLKFNTDEALNLAPTPPKVSRDVFGAKVIETKIAPSIDHILGMMGYDEAGEG